MVIALQRLVVQLDPRRSLATAIGWLIVTLSLGLAAGAGFLAGHLTRNTLLDQRSERAANAAEQWSRGLDGALAQRRQPLQTAASMLAPAVARQDSSRLAAVFADLRVGYPEFTWVGLANREGRLLASTPENLSERDNAGGADVSQHTWFREGLQRSWIAASKPTPGHEIHLSVPVMDSHGDAIGVVAARLDWTWLRDAAETVRARVPLLADGQALVVDASGRIVIGPADRIGLSLTGNGNTSIEVTEAKGDAASPNGTGSSLRALGWRAVVTWPAANVTRGADAARQQIVWLSLALGLAASAVGVTLARRLTQRLTVLSNDVLALKPPANRLLDVPGGDDEVSQLGHSFNRLLASLQNERRALTFLTGELEARVQARTSEVERLADETRYAAVVRERLRIARDLHDTLAHSMMEMLAEVRILRKLHSHDPSALAAELERAEKVARDGLHEARGAITQMRFNGVRDLGLGPALGAATSHFATRTGIEVDYTFGKRAANFGDSRAVAMFRIAEEALRNIEQHAQATRVVVSLEDIGSEAIELVISDNGTGFDAAKIRPGHYGLVGLREQSQLIDATLDIVSTSGRGTSVSLRLRSEPTSVSLEETS